MSYKNSYFILKNGIEPNDEGLKLKLGSLRGVINMDIHSDTNSVSVDYDDTFVHEEQISGCLEDIGYKLSPSLHHTHS